MAFCSKCGTKVNDGVKFCTACGSPISVPHEPVMPQSPPMQQPHTQPTAGAAQSAVINQQHNFPQSPLQSSMSPGTSSAAYTEEPISTGGYIGIFFLMMIPVVNILCLIIWACGGCKKRNQTNLARATLVWMLISMVLSGVIMLIVWLFFGELYSEVINGFSNEYLNELNELKELGESLNNFKK